MKTGKNKGFSGFITVFHDRRLPEKGIPAGYAAIIDAYGLQVPLPRGLCAIGERHKMVEKNGWRLFSPRYNPESTLKGHITFALKYEGIDLAVLHSLFSKIDQTEIAGIVENAPTGAYARRIWFLYEWLTARRLPLEDLKQGTYVHVLDPAMQLTVSGERIKRQRVVDNLPGTPRFCPLVFRSKRIREFQSNNLKEEVRQVIGRIPNDIIARTAAFLLLKDSKASFIIEGEEPPRQRMERWGKAIGEAGITPLEADELIRLQKIIIGDNRFVRLGLRTQGGFVGEHDRDSGMPIPEHISARAEDLQSLIEGLIAFYKRASDELDPVAAAASLSFGFVYVHPFEDGNGRIHRYIIHHILTQSGFNPPGLVFPVSAVFLERIDEYRKVLQQYSHKILPLIEWEAADDRNINVKNETDYLYRFFDATLHTEFLFSCIEQAIEKELPAEIEFLKKYDEFRKGVEAIVDMPEKTINLLFRFLRQNSGTLSKRAREKEFKPLLQDEVEHIQKIYKETAGKLSRS